MISYIVSGGAGEVRSWAVSWKISRLSKSLKDQRLFSSPEALAQEDRLKLTKRIWEAKQVQPQGWDHERDICGEVCWELVPLCSYHLYWASVKHLLMVTGTLLVRMSSSHDEELYLEGYKQEICFWQLSLYLLVKTFQESWQLIASYISHRSFFLSLSLLAK